jgi:hypothetical protein
MLLAAGLVLGACGGDSGGGPDPAEDPKGALTNAFENLGEYEGVDMTFSVDSTAEDLAAVAEGDLTEEQADMILNSSINMKAVGGESAEDTQVEFVVDIDGSLVEMRLVNGVLYARADVRDLVDQFGGSQEEVDAAAAQAGAQYDFVQPLIDGDWVGFEGAEALSQQFGGALPSPDAELQKQLTDDLAQAVSDSATVTEEGSDDAGSHLVADVNIKELYGALQESFGSLSQVPGTELPPADDVPDENISVDFWVDDGFLTQVGFDFVQFRDVEGVEDFPEGVDEFGLLLELDEFSDGVDEPDAAATVNLQELMGGLMGGLGGLGGTDTDTGGSGSFSDEEICETLKDSPPEVQAQFAEQCPEFAQ